MTFEKGKEYFNLSADDYNTLISVGDDSMDSFLQANFVLSNGSYWCANEDAISLGNDKVDEFYELLEDTGVELNQIVYIYSNQGTAGF